MFDHLDLQSTRERLLVGLADQALSAMALPGRLMRARPLPKQAESIDRLHKASDNGLYHYNRRGI